jgi:hypothetical protein
MKKRLIEAMEKVNFIQKPVELAQSSQVFIESLWEIVTEVSKLYAPLTSIFSYFFGFLVSTISYQSSLNRSIQEFTLTRFKLLFPYYLEAEGVTPRGSEYFPAQTGKLAMPFLLNLSMVREVSKVAVPLAKEPAKLASFPKPQEPEIAGKVIEKQLAEAPQETLVQRIMEVQTQLWSRLTPTMKNLSSTFIEYERKAIPIAFLAATSRPVLLNSTVFAGLTPYRFVTPLEEEKEKPSFPEPSSKEAGEASLDKALMAEAAPSELTGGITLERKTLRVVGYATKLPTAISEKQTTFLKSVTPISRGSLSPSATFPSIEPSPQYAGTVPERHAKFKPEIRHAAVKAFRLPSILTSLMAYYSQTYPWLPPEPAVSQTYETPFEVEQLTSEETTTPSEISETQKPSKPPITLALAATEKLLPQRQQKELTALMKRIQISRSTYARTIADLGAAGPIRTTMLDELSVGLTIPYALEPSTSYAEAVSQRPLIQSAMSPTSQDIIKVNVFADTAEEDLRDLERKISRILSEQISRYYGSSRI